MLNRARIAPLLAAALVVLALGRIEPASAELTIEITQGVTDPIPIAIVPFGWDSVGAPPFDVAELVAANQRRQRSFGRERQARPAQPHQLEDLGRVDALDAGYLVEDAQRGVTARQLRQRFGVAQVAHALDSELLAVVEGAELGLDDAADEA